MDNKSAILLQSKLEGINRQINQLNDKYEKVEECFSKEIRMLPPDLLSHDHRGDIIPVDITFYQWREQHIFLVQMSDESYVKTFSPETEEFSVMWTTTKKKEEAVRVPLKEAVSMYRKIKQARTEMIPYGKGPFPLKVTD